VRAGLGTSTRPEAASAVEEAVDAALEGLAGAAPDAVIVAATAALGSRALSGLLDRTARVLDGAVWLGASVEGLLTSDREIVGLPGFAVAALSGVGAELFSCEDLAGREEEAADEIADQLSSPPEAEDLLIVFADSLGLASEPLLGSLRRVAGPARVLGLGASELPGASPRLWGAGDFVEGGCCGLRLRTPRAAQIAVTDGSRPIGEEMEITRVRGRWVTGLDGGPALPRLLEAGGGSSPNSGAPGVLARLRKPAAGPPESGAVIRNLTGFDPAREAFALPVPASLGDRLCFVRLDPVAAREHLGACLDGLGSGRPRLGLYFSCRSRGERLFKHAGLESGYLARALGGAPLLGMMGAFQLAPDPRSGVPLLHTYSGVLARFEG
jgi:small ligand-binding sensory domain FIST